MRATEARKKRFVGPVHDELTPHLWELIAKSNIFARGFHPQGGVRSFKGGNLLSATRIESRNSPNSAANRVPQRLHNLLSLSMFDGKHM